MSSVTMSDWLGWCAAALTLLTFLARDMALLRILALAANISFIAYAASARLWPVLTLHVVLVPVNVGRLLELFRYRRRLAQPKAASPSPLGLTHPRSMQAPKAPATTASALILVCCLLALASAATVASPGSNYADRAHARAVESFRVGRFPEAYGRFVALAEAGHAPSARYALWMCEQGPALFGKDWDCTPQQISDWAKSAGVLAPQIEIHSYAASAPAKAAKKR
jgi:hypothetical protein